MAPFPTLSHTGLYFTADGLFGQAQFGRSEQFFA